LFLPAKRFEIVLRYRRLKSSWFSTVAFNNSTTNSQAITALQLESVVSFGCAFWFPLID
jgi:hypothetical protein